VEPSAAPQAPLYTSTSLLNPFVVSVNRLGEHRRHTEPQSPFSATELLPAYEVTPSLSPAAYPDYSYTMPTERRGSAASIDSLQSNDTYSSFSSSYNSPAPYFHHHSPVHHVYETQEPCAPSPYWLAAPTPWSHSHSHLTPYPGSPIDYLPPLQSTSLPSSSFHTYASLSSDVLSCNLPPHIPHRPSAPLSRRVQWGMVETPSEPRPLLISHLSEPSSNWNPRDELGRRPLSWSQSTFGHEGLYPGETYS
jgi:hypothetical protein